MSDQHLLVAFPRPCTLDRLERIHLRIVQSFLGKWIATARAAAGAFGALGRAVLALLPHVEIQGSDARQTGGH